MAVRPFKGLGSFSDRRSRILPALPGLARCFILAAATLALCAHAKAARSSTSDPIPAESTDAAGASVHSTSYCVHGGGVGELYEPVALAVTAPPANTINEATTKQLAEDGTTIADLPATTVS